MVIVSVHIDVSDAKYERGFYKSSIEFTVNPPALDAPTIQRIFTEMENHHLSRWRYDVAAGSGSFYLRDDDSLFAPGGRMWIDVAANRIDFQSEPGGERLEAGVQPRVPVPS